MTKLNTTTSRKVSLNKYMGECYIADYLSPEEFIAKINTFVANQLKSYSKESPTNIKLRVYSHDSDDDTTNFELYADIIESVEDYEKRLAAIKELQEQEERAAIKKAEDRRLFLEQWEKDREEVLALSDDPEFAEYERLKAKFKRVEDNRK